MRIRRAVALVRTVPSLLFLLICMGAVYPFLMSPAFDPRPWGTLDLSPIYPGHRFDEKIGESWLTGDDCKVANGPLRGQSLAELARQYGRALVGEAAAEANRFPLLTKFLFPHEKLSVQVHPDDEAAQSAGHPWGKTECWYVVHAKPGAQLALGLKEGATRAQFEEAIHQQRAEQLLNWINIFPGEMIYVPGGTVHTLGPGSIIVETQQQSDTTYRLYDYGRARELHLKEGLAAVKEKARAGKIVRPAPVALGKSKNHRAPLVASPYFVVDLFELKEPQEFRAGSGKSSVAVLIAVEGCGAVEAGDSEPLTFAKGDAIVIPASVRQFHIRPQWALEFLKAELPHEATEEPSVRL